ncbi:hypothetical protein O7626_00175 [Micromonospora sp. WMMD1102]|uniref:hypothetical protein n=1 Tax=Micromonospora sp. WMMD1102 TaxID=3016105 RepID=UPI0024151D59|nr:hypothetical protein [Micromonospora sp. WMMD1102]MDG4784361.1 hypothetical protein [Micromonospora sp. WMMD1102]
MTVASDKRELLLVIKGDDKASGPLKKVGDAADDAKDDLKDLNAGLKKLDDASADATAQIAKLRAEIAKTGDLELVKDLAKQEQRLKAFARQRKLLLGDSQVDTKGVADIGVGIGARLGPIVVQSLGQAVGKAGPGIAIGAPIVAGVATWLTSAAGGAVLAGAAVGAVAGGVKLASKDPRVQAAGAEMANSIGNQLERAAEPFVPATLGAIRTVRSGFRDLDDELSGIFGSAADYVQPLARALVGLGKNAAPSLERLVRAAGPVVTMLGRELPELGDDIGSALDSISDSAPAAARSLGLVLDIAGAGIKTVGGAVELASKAFMYADVLAAAFRGGVAEAAGTAGEYATAAAEADRESTDWAAALADLGNKAGAAAVEVESLHDAQVRITNSNLSAAEANLRVAEAIDAVKEAADGRKRVTRAEEAALYDLARSLNEATAAFDDQGHSAHQASERNQQIRRDFIRAAEAAGHSRKEAERLANQYLNMPKGAKLTITANTKQAANALSAVRNTLNALDGRVARASVYISAYRKNSLPAYSEGGPVLGPGPKGVDSRLAMLAPGEYVLSARDVDKLGGSARIDEWRKGLHDASRPAVAGGASMRGGGGAVIQLAAAPGAPGELVRYLMPYLQVRVLNGYGGSAQRAFSAGRG